MKRKLFVFLMVMVLAVALPANAFASSGGGSGGGSGSGSGGGEGGGKNPLTLEEAAVSDGQQNVALDAELKFVFSNNVINLSVKENNATCFSLTDESGAVVPLEVVMGDDQLEADLKEIIIIKPEGGLQAGKTYTLVMDQALQAKNGNTLGSDISITFSTAAAAAPVASGSNTALIIVIALVVIALVVFMVRRNAKKAK